MVPAMPGDLAGWAALDAELDLWAAAGRVAGLWWRDDDAVAPTPALESLLTIRAKLGLPLALAVIPARAQPALAARLAGEDGLAVWQHGWAHLNHSPAGAPKAELGPDRPTGYVLGELARGWLAMDRVFGETGWHKALVPPHNRIAPALAAALPAAGYAGLSAGLGPRPAGLRFVVNAHVDIMDWTTRRFAGEAVALAALVGALAARRDGRADPDEPVGFLTHHLAHDIEAWRFTEAALARLAAHRATRFSDPGTLFE
jgi:hypothetical protein